jgi:hypothetical protein
VAQVVRNQQRLAVRGGHESAPVDEERQRWRQCRRGDDPEAPARLSGQTAVSQDRTESFVLGALLVIGKLGLADWIAVSDPCVWGIG